MPAAENPAHAAINKLVSVRKCNADRMGPRGTGMIFLGFWGWPSVGFIGVHHDKHRCIRNGFMLCGRFPPSKTFPKIRKIPPCFNVHPRSRRSIDDAHLALTPENPTIPFDALWQFDEGNARRIEVISGRSATSHGAGFHPLGKWHTGTWPEVMVAIPIV